MTESILDATKDKAPSMTETLVPSPEVQEREKLDRDIAKAERKQAIKIAELKKRDKARAEAPDGVDMSQILDEDPMDGIVRELVPEAFGSPKKRGRASASYDYRPGATMRAYWGQEGEHKRLIDEGWIPVVKEGEHASYNELKLYKRDIELTREILYAQAKRSRVMLETPDTSVRDAAKAGGGKVMEDVLEITKEKIT